MTDDVRDVRKIESKSTISPALTIHTIKFEWDWVYDRAK